MEAAHCLGRGDASLAEIGDGHGVAGPAGLGGRVVLPLGPRRGDARSTPIREVDGAAARAGSLAVVEPALGAGRGDATSAVGLGGGDVDAVPAGFVVAAAGRAGQRPAAREDFGEHVDAAGSTALVDAGTGLAAQVDVAAAAGLTALVDAATGLAAQFDVAAPAGSTALVDTATGLGGKFPSGVSMAAVAAAGFAAAFDKTASSAIAVAEPDGTGDGVEAACRDGFAEPDAEARTDDGI